MEEEEFVPAGDNPAHVEREAPVANAPENKGWWRELVYFLLPIVIFWIMWMIMSSQAVTFFWKAFTATLIALGSLPLAKMIAKPKGNHGSSIFLIILGLFMLTMVMHYATPNNNSVAQKTVVKKGITTESNSFSQAGESWIVSNVFYGGENVKIEVSGGPVQMMGGRTMEVGEYYEKINSYGAIGFESLTNIPTKVKVSYKK